MDQSLVFVNAEIAKTFECAICYQILKRPVQMGCSDHIFCTACIKETISPESDLIRCPICRASCKTESIRRVKFVERQINNLLVKCPNHVITTQKARYLTNKKGFEQDENQEAGDGSSQSENDEDVDLFLRDDVCGQKRKRTHDDAENKTIKKRKLNDEFEDICDWIGPLSDLTTSHNQQCPLQLVTCHFCTEPMLRTELVRHHQDCGHFPLECSACGQAGILRHFMDLHIENLCSMTMISCPEQCGVQLQRGNAKQHIKEVCTETTIKCAFHRFGCFETFKRKDEMKHIQNTLMNHTHLVKVSEKVNELTKENEQLCLRINALEQDHEAMEEKQEAIKDKYDALVAQQQKQNKQHNAFERKQEQRYQALKELRKKQFRYVFERMNQAQREGKSWSAEWRHHWMDRCCITGADIDYY
eukprot:790184_1